MTDQMIRALRAIVKLVAFPACLLFVAGFVAQFLSPAEYPWAATVQSYTGPVARAIQGFLPTVYTGVDFSLLLALVFVWIIYSRIDQVLWRVEDNRMRRLAEAKIAAARGKPVPHVEPVSPSPSTPPSLYPNAPSPPPAAAPAVTAPVYRSEAIAVIDLVSSTDIVTRFGNTLLLTLKHRLEHHAGPIASRHEAGYAESTGDGFLIFFPSMAKAVAAVHEIFQKIPSLNVDLPEGVEVALRAALNFGEILVDRDGHRTGSAIHKTFRLEGLSGATLIEAQGGIRPEEFPDKNYILASEEAASILQKVQGLQCRFLGNCELKGFPGIHRVYKI
ncbi:MAG: adenylate/guanylate cyclase domain-containing protein [Deltaproteobacteria bacterium]|nr:adenylate/guanylate cyclase domain-containing protein [Deltaproteobacteria bacterium]